MKQKQPKNHQIKKIMHAKAFLVIGIVIAATLAVTPFAYASNLQQRINELSRQNANRQGEVADLSEEATTLEDKISRIQTRINAIQGQINTYQDEIAKLEKEIAKAEAELQKQRNLLGQNIRAMYLEGDISTLEMLASSKDLSEFVDKQQYRNAVQDKIRTTLDTINALKDELREKRAGVEQRLKEQKRLRTEEEQKRVEVRGLLSLNESERAALDSAIRKTSKEIEELKRQQAIENMRLFGGSSGQIGGGGYPWGYAKCIHTGQVDGWCPNYDWGVNGSIWNFATGGYGYRNCTDWVSFRVRSTGRFVPGGLGNAKTWDDRAPSYGYTVSSTPKAGAAAVSNSGFYGHVMYVEAVNGDGSIVVSDYNRAGTGKYDMNTISSSGLSFVYF